MLRDVLPRTTGASRRLAHCNGSEAGSAARSRRSPRVSRATHRGAGLIQQLLSEAEAWLEVIGVRQVRLHVNEANTRALDAYLKCGYIDTGVRVDMVDGINHEMVRTHST